MDADTERRCVAAESKREQSELARQDSERRRVTAEAERVQGEADRRAASTEVAQTVATLTELLTRMEAVEQLRRNLRSNPPE
jgi:hypothetical protein